jgi:hypothetical protein
VPRRSLGEGGHYRITQKSNITLDANYDVGSNYRSCSAGLSSAWRF